MRWLPLCAPQGPVVKHLGFTGLPFHRDVNCLLLTPPAPQVLCLSSDIAHLLVISTYGAQCGPRPCPQRSWQLRGWALWRWEVAGPLRPDGFAPGVLKEVRCRAEWGLEGFPVTAETEGALGGRDLRVLGRERGCWVTAAPSVSNQPASQVEPQPNFGLCCGARGRWGACALAAPGPAALEQLHAGPHPARAKRPVWGTVVSAQHPGGLGDRGLGSAQAVYFGSKRGGHLGLDPHC